MQTNSALSNTRADSANLAHSHLLSIHKGIHPQMKQEYPLSQHRLKKKDDDTVSDEDAEEEENELKICGAKCRKIPENIKAKFIRKMFDD